MAATFPPLGPTTLTKTIPAYVYEQYADDDSIQALNSAYNTIAQSYVNFFANISLPIYTWPLITGTLLDWVGSNLYGVPRPVLPSGRTRTIGPPNTFVPNQLPPNTRKAVGQQVYYSVSDDVYKRCITWNYYKGDGRTFTVRWLKRRIARFMFGVNGTAPPISSTYQISVSFGPGNQANIRLINGNRVLSRGASPGRFAPNTRAPNSYASQFNPLPPLPNASTFAAALNAGVLQLPFQFDWTVTIESGPNTAYFTDVGSVLHVSSGAGYPVSAAGLPPGDVWSNGTVVTVVPGITPDPSAPPMFFPGITPAELLATGGGNLPLTAGVSGSGQLWNNVDVVNVS